MVKKIFLPILCALIGLSSGCGIYSFTGASVDPAATTVNVQEFTNNADYVNPTLAQKLTRSLRDKITSQTKLAQVNSPQVDYIFKSTITQYSTSTVAVTDVEQAATARLTVAIKVEFISNLNPDDDFTQTFSRSADFAANKTLDQVQGSLIDDISDQLIQDVFNKAFVNW